MGISSELFQSQLREQELLDWLESLQIEDASSAAIEEALAALEAQRLISARIRKAEHLARRSSS